MPTDPTGPDVRRSSRATATLALATLLAACGGAELAQVPAGYHQMADGVLMADIDPGMVDVETELRALGTSGVEVAVHVLPDGEVVLGSAPGAHAGHEGSAGGHDHPVPTQAEFPAGIEPVRVVIPGLDVDALTPAMSIDPLEAPPVAGDVGWIAQTRRPGEVGPAVLGAFSSVDGTASALADIDRLVAGDEVLVVGRDGTTLRFVVDGNRSSTEQDRRSVFAMGEGRPELRLVAWGVDGAEDLVVSAFQDTGTG